MFGRNVHALICLIAAAALLGCLGGPAGASVAATAGPAIAPHGRGILLLYSYGHGGQGIGVFDEGLLASLRSGGVKPNDLYFEFLDLERNKQDPEYVDDLRHDLQRKYGGGKIGLIITIQQPARNFILARGAGIAPGAPVMTVQAPVPDESEAGRRKILCQVGNFDVKGTIALALDLFPASRRLVVVAGSSAADKTAAAAVAVDLAPLKDRLAIEYTTGQSLDEILKNVANLPPDTILLFSQFNRDGNGRVTVSYEVEGMVAKAASGPLFGLYDFNLRNGGVGGSVISVSGLGEKTGRLATEILDGNLRLLDSVTVERNFPVPMFDWKEIRRRNGQIEKLPANAVIFNKPQTLWGAYRWYALAGGLLLATQSLLIGTLLVQRRWKKKALARYASVIRTAMDGVWLNDMEGRVLDVNDAYCAMIGYGRAELLLMGISDVEANEDPLKIGEHIQKIIETGQDRFESRHRCKNGDIIDVEVSAQFQEGDGKRIVAFIRNITGLKEAREKQKAIELQLLQSQKMEGIGQLAGGVAHDFNNILAAMMMHLYILKNDPKLDQKTREALTELENHTNRAAALTRQLLMFSRRSVMDVRSLDLNEVVANLLKMLGRILGEHVTLVFERRYTLPPIEADAGMLEQVLLNLVVNARDAMPRGGRITIATEAVDVDPGRAEGNPARRAGPFVCLSVSDTGCGMDAGTLGRIFEPFFTTKEVGKGTGLGLSTVDGIVGQHRGWIEVASDVGGGSTFRIYLPASARPAEMAQENGTPMTPGGKETILVVEDEANLRKILTGNLKALGYRVLESGNGPEAMTIWREQCGRIDLLLTDMVMPGGMTGLDLVEKMRAETPGLKVIVSSGYSAETTLPGEAKPGGIVYLPKPYTIPGMATTVRDCLDRP